MAHPTQTIAFFGATGGTSSSCLAAALLTGHHCTARTYLTLLSLHPLDLPAPVVRTPAKLLTILTTQFSIPIEIIDTYLTIHPGDAKSPIDVALAIRSPLNKSCTVDTIITSIGSYIVPSLSLRTPFVLPAADASICEDGMRAILAALETLDVPAKPRLIAVMATAGPDVKVCVPWPWILAPMYVWLLGAPHADKRKMEKVVWGDAGKRFGGWVISIFTLLIIEGYVADGILSSPGDFEGCRGARDREGEGWMGVG
jgi:hypothetical protein